MWVRSIVSGQPTSDQVSDRRDFKRGSRITLDPMSCPQRVATVGRRLTRPGAADVPGLRVGRARLAGLGYSGRQSGTSSEKCTAGIPSTVTNSVPGDHVVPGVIQGGVPFG